MFHSRLLSLVAKTCIKAALKRKGTHFLQLSLFLPMSLFDWCRQSVDMQHANPTQNSLSSFIGASWKLVLKIEKAASAATVRSQNAWSCKFLLGILNLCGSCEHNVPSPSICLWDLYCPCHASSVSRKSITIQLSSVLNSVSQVMQFWAMLQLHKSTLFHTISVSICVGCLHFSVLFSLISLYCLT